jgi:hypothetical protein
MAVQITIFERKDTMNPEADVNRYTGVKCTGDVTLKSSNREMFKCRTVTRADALAVSDGLLYDRLFPPWAFPHVYGHTNPPAEADKSSFTKL